MQLTEHNPSHLCIKFVQQHTKGWEVGRGQEIETYLKGQGEVRMKGQGEVRRGQGEVRRGQGKVRMKGSGRGHDERSGQGQACRDMSWQRALQTSPGDGLATKPTNQELTRSPRHPIRS